MDNLVVIGLIFEKVIGVHVLRHRPTAVLLQRSLVASEVLVAAGADPLGSLDFSLILLSKLDWGIAGCDRGGGVVLYIRVGDRRRKRAALHRTYRVVLDLYSVGLALWLLTGPAHTDTDNY
jgi:hypothetical protein